MFATFLWKLVNPFAGLVRKCDILHLMLWSCNFSSVSDFKKGNTKTFISITLCYLHICMCVCVYLFIFIYVLALCCTVNDLCIFHILQIGLFGCNGSWNGCWKCPVRHSVWCATGYEALHSPRWSNSQSWQIRNSHYTVREKRGMITRMIIIHEEMLCYIMI